MVTYEIEVNENDGTYFATCTTPASSTWMTSYILATIVIFFVFPMILLTVLYSVIARHLMTNPVISRGPANNLLRHRKQVVLMLSTVVLCFFVFLLPFRLFTFFIICVQPQTIISLHVYGYYSILYSTRMMLYGHSAINPILYNLMSTKFREGFLKLCGFRSKQHKKKNKSEPTDTYTIGSTNCSSNHSNFWRQYNSNKSCDVNVSCNDYASVKQIKLHLFTTVVTGNIVKKNQESYV